VVVGDLNIPLSPIDGSFKQKFKKEILELNDTIDQMDLTDVYRIFHPTSAQYTFLSAAHGTFTKMDSILGHKASLSKYKQKRKEITPCILSNHNTIKLEQNKSNSREYAYNWRLNNTFINDQWVIEEIRKSKGSWKLMKMKTPPTRTYGTHQRQS
jgi:hypothetical protein